MCKRCCMISNKLLEHDLRKLSNNLCYLDFQHSMADSSMFFYLFSSQHMVVILLYIDDIIITRSNSLYVNFIINLLNDTFRLNNLSTLSFFLGLEVSRDDESLYLLQHKYIKQLISKADLDSFKINLSDPNVYWSIISVLQYCVLTILEIAYLVNNLCLFLQAHINVYQVAAKYVLHYLKCTLQHGLSIQKYDVLGLISLFQWFWLGHLYSNDWWSIRTCNLFWWLIGVMIF